MQAPDRQHRVAAIADALALPPPVTIRIWAESDFPAAVRLSSEEGWSTPGERPGASGAAWRRSWPALVVVADGAVIGFLRALSDGAVTTYVADLLVIPAWRRQGLASALLETSRRLHPGTRLELLATEASADFYARGGFRPWRGFRLAWAEREAASHRS